MRVEVRAGAAARSVGERQPVQCLLAGANVGSDNFPFFHVAHAAAHSIKPTLDPKCVGIFPSSRIEVNAEDADHNHCVSRIRKSTDTGFPIGWNSSRM